nr:hypothetical protein Iba_chr04dCG10540 [Ipomoea batatas]
MRRARASAAASKLREPEKIIVTEEQIDLDENNEEEEVDNIINQTMKRNFETLSTMAPQRCSDEDDLLERSTNKPKVDVGLQDTMDSDTGDGSPSPIVPEATASDVGGVAAETSMEVVDETGEDLGGETSILGSLEAVPETPLNEQGAKEVDGLSTESFGGSPETLIETNGARGSETPSKTARAAEGVAPKKSYLASVVGTGSDSIPFLHGTGAADGEEEIFTPPRANQMRREGKPKMQYLVNIRM